MELKLGRLEKVDIRSVWESEPADFTPWLAKEENLKHLGETIGLELELEAQEKDVGPFRADILCKDVATNNWVLIENQLEKTDHTHLGQIITYASGLKAVNIIWIAKQFTEEHRSAIDWLNEVTDPTINFFGVEVELLKIGSSETAANFNVVSKPNDWAKTVIYGNSGSVNKELSETKQAQLKFWTEFSDYLRSKSKKLSPTKPFPQHWMNISIGRSGFKLAAIASFYSSSENGSSKHEIRAEFVMDSDQAKKHFETLEADKVKIEKELGVPLIWHNPENTKSCKMYLQKDTDLLNENQKDKNFEWLSLNLEKLYDVFSKRVKELD